MILKLGENKEVELTAWKAKAKKDFVKLFKTKDTNITEKDVLDTLVYPYITNPGIYYSEDEIQYILIKLREISVNAPIKFMIECEECETENNVETDLAGLVDYKESKYPIEIDGIVWRDLKEKNEYIRNSKNNPEETPLDVKIFSHVESIKGKPVSRIQDVVDYVENLTFAEEEDFVKAFNKANSSIDIHYVVKCSKCDFERDYDFDVIPTFFDPLMPKS